MVLAALYRENVGEDDFFKKRKNSLCFKGVDFCANIFCGNSFCGSLFLHELLFAGISLCDLTKNGQKPHNAHSFVSKLLLIKYSTLLVMKDSSYHKHNPLFLT